MSVIRLLTGILENLRHTGVFVVDMLIGGKHLKHYRDIRMITENPVNISSVERHSEYLANILQHAKATVPFYKELKAGVDLTEYPVVNKNFVKQDIHRFYSEKYGEKDVIKATTSGSTGAPFTVIKDKNKRLRHQAENIYFSEIIGYQPGTRLYYLRVWNEINRKSPVKSWMQNVIMQDASGLSDAEFHDLWSKLKKDNSSKSILAFASSLEAFSRFIEQQGSSLPDVDVECVISISESLPDGAKEILKKKLNCPVICRYSNIENGFLAQQCIEENNEYHLNLASFHFELLHPDKDEPVQPGEAGRIVVTDLFNYAMPLIRYDTGDMAIYSETSSCGNPGPVFTKVEGRRVDFIYSTDGRLLSPHVITNTMWRYASVVKQFQFLQNDRDQYVIRLNCGDDDFTEKETLLNDLKHFVGKDASITIEMVNDIPALASGKRKKIVNNYRPS